MTSTIQVLPRYPRIGGVACRLEPYHHVDWWHHPVQESSPVLSEAVDPCGGFGKETTIVQYRFCVELVCESIELGNA